MRLAPSWRAASSSSVYHWPSRYIEASPLRDGAGSPGRTGSLARAATVAAEDLPRPRGARRPVVAVGDVERRDAAESGREGTGVGPGDAPESVHHPVFGREVVERGRRAGMPRDRVDLGRGAIGEEHDPGLGAQRDHVARAVVLLVAPGELVLLDQPLLVLVDRVARREPGLLVPAGAEAIEVEARLGIEGQRRRPPQLREAPHRLLVNLVRMDIGAGREIDLGTGDMEEAERVALRLRPGLLGVDDVVRDGRDTGGHLGHRAQRLEGSDR